MSQQYAAVATSADHADTGTNSAAAAAATASPSPSPAPFVDLSGRIDHTSPPSKAKPIDDSLDGRINGANSSNSSSSNNNSSSSASSSNGSSSAVSGLTSFLGSFFSAPAPTSSSSNSGSMNLDSGEVSGLVAKLKSRNWAGTLRPLPIFAGQQLFSKPRTTAEATARLEANLPFFLTNYLAICLLVAVITILSQPSLLFVGAVLVGMWLLTTRADEFRVGQYAIAGRNKMIVLSSVTGIVLFIFAGSTIFFLLGVCASIVVAHAVFHNLPSLDDSTEMDSMIAGQDFADPSPA